MMCNMNVEMSEQLNRLMLNTVKEAVRKSVEACANKYNFDASEAIRALDLDSMKVVRKGVKAPKAPKEKPIKASIPLPYNGEFNDSCCYGLRQNSGLYTQCQVVRKDNKSYCKVCECQAKKNENGKPDYGTIQDRNAVDILDFVDPKGKKPVAFYKIMKKNKLTQEQVIEEAKKINMNIHECHFIVLDTESKRGRPKGEAKEKKSSDAKKGRPKKSKKVLEIEGDDLFASLVASANSDVEDSSSDASSDADETDIVIIPKKAKSVMSEEEKAAKEAKIAAAKAEKEAKIAAAKAEKEAKLALEKAEKEAKLALEKAEKEAKIAAAKAEKEAKLALEKAEKEAKIAADKAAKEAAKEAEKAAKEAAKAEKKKEPKKSSKKEEEEEEEARPQDIVKKFEYEGVKYLKSKNTGVIYNLLTDVVGKWNDVTNKIDFDAVEEEEEEEEYDEEEEE